MITFEKARSQCNGNEDEEEWLLTLKAHRSQPILNERAKMTKRSTGNYFNGGGVSF